MKYHGKHITRLTVIGVLSTLILTGCGNLRLHNPATEEITTAAAEAHGKIDHKAMMEAEAAFLSDLNSKTEAVVTNQILADRDAALSEWLGGPVTGTDENSWDLMKSFIGTRAKEVLGDPNMLPRFHRPANFDMALRAKHASLDNQKTIIRTQTTIFLRNGGQAKNLCVDLRKEIGTPKYSSAADETQIATAKAAYFLIKIHCGQLKSGIKSLNSFLGFTAESNLPKGDLLQTNRLIAQTEALLTVQAALEKEASRELGKLTGHYNCVVSDAGDGSEAEVKIRAAAKLVGVFLELLEGTPLPEIEQQEDDGKDKASRTPACEPPVPPTEEIVQKLLDKAGLDTGMVNDAREGIAGIKFLDVANEALIRVASDIREHNAFQFFDMLTDPEKQGDSKETKVAGILFNAMLRLSEISASADPESNAEIALVSIAHQRFKSETAKVNRNALQKLLANLNARRLSHISEVVNLARADAALTALKDAGVLEGHETYSAFQVSDADAAGKRQAAIVMAALNDAWNHGILPSHLSVYQELQIGREKNLAIEHATLTARDSLISPVITLLDSYGKAGVKTADIARAVNLILLGFTANGVN